MAGASRHDTRPASGVRAAPSYGCGAHTPKLSVIVPVHNERSTLEEVLARVQAVPIDKEIVIVDDGSTDGSAEYLRTLQQELSGKSDGIHVLFQEKNRGKGAALRRGFQAARGEFVIIQDADLELDPRDYSKLMQPIEDGLADVVYGSRFLVKQSSPAPFLHIAGNRCLTALSNSLTHLGLSDVWTCYKVFRRKSLLEIHLREDRFGFEPEITAKIAKRRWRVREVPVSYQRRSRLQGKKIGWKDGAAGVWCTVRYSLFD